MFIPLLTQCKICPSPSQPPGMGSSTQPLLLLSARMSVRHS